MDSKLPVELLTSVDLHDRVIQRELMCAERTVWIDLCPDPIGQG